MKKLILAIAILFLLPSFAYPQVMVTPGMAAANTTGPASATTGYSVCFDGTSGKILKECTGAAYLYAIAGLTPTDGNIIVGNGSTWVAESGATARASLGLAIGTDVQAYSAGLASLAGLTETNGGIPYGTADNTYAWLAAGTSGYLLKGNGAGAPSWTNSLENITIGGFTATAGMVPITDGSGNLANSFFGVAGMTTAIRVKTFSDASATVVEYAQAGTGSIATTGTISGGTLTPVIDDPDNFAANFTGANLYGGTFIANAAGTAALPAVAAGMNFTIVLETTGAVIIDPDGSGTADTIYMNGLAAAQDENITSSTRGAMCVFQYRAADTWMATCNGFAEATPP